MTDIDSNHALRSYQSADIERINRALATTGKVMYRLPTGAGKTVIFAHIAKRMSEGKQRTLILTHRRMLVSQTVSKLMSAGVHCGVIASGYPACLDRSVQVASIQSYIQRKRAFTPAQRAFNLVVIDEAHHSCSSQFAAILSDLDARLLGVTATPMRLDGAALAPSYKTLIHGAGERELIRGGWLADYDLYLPPGMHDPLWGITSRKTEVTKAEAEQAVSITRRHGDAVTLYQQHLNGKRAVAFCYSIADAEANAAAFRATGIAAAAISGNDNDSRMASIIRAYDKGHIKVLAACDVISEGFDIPQTAGVLLMRKTMSAVLYRQQIGRAMRPKNDGSRAIIIDMVGNVLTHGLPDENKSWSLNGRLPRIKRATHKSKILLRRCGHCCAVSRVSANKCRLCGHALDDRMADFYTERKNTPLILVDRNLICVATFPFRADDFKSETANECGRCFPAYKQRCQMATVGRKAQWAQIIRREAANDRELDCIPDDVEGFGRGWLRGLLADKERQRRMAKWRPGDIVRR